jgi:hypothetical protein
MDKKQSIKKGRKINIRNEEKGRCRSKVERKYRER